MFQLLSRTLVIFGAVLFSSMNWAGSVWAAPCCGGSSTLPSVIIGDDQAQFSLLMSQGSVIGDAPVEGPPVFRQSRDREQVQTLKLDGAYHLGDRFQVGASLPLIRRSREGGELSSEAKGVGDINLNSAYEFLPEYSYSIWKPKGFVFLQMTLPTAPSVYNATSTFLMDARGRGFFTVSAGTVFVKTLRAWDLLLSLEAHRSFSRTFQTSDDSTQYIQPGWGGSAIWGVGLSPGFGPFRVGLSLSPVYESPIRVESDFNSTSAPQWVWNTSFQLSYSFPQDWALHCSYMDQALLGSAKNVSLSRVLALSFQKRFPL